MINPETTRKIRSHPRFDVLVGRRRRLTVALAVSAVGMYFLFAILLTFAGDFLASPMVSGGTVTWGLLITFVIIVLTVLLTGIYVHRMNHVVDRPAKEIIDEVSQ